MARECRIVQRCRGAASNGKIGKKTNHADRAASNESGLTGAADVRAILKSEVQVWEVWSGYSHQLYAHRERNKGRKGKESCADAVKISQNLMIRLGPPRVCGTVTVTVCEKRTKEGGA